MKTLQKDFTSVHCLVHPIFYKTLIVKVGSIAGVGAILLEQQDNSQTHSLHSFIICYSQWSRTISKRELLGIMFTLEVWRQWLKGAAKLLLSILTIRTSNTNEKPRGQIQCKPDGPCFSPYFILPSPITWGPRMLKRMLSLISMPPKVSQNET